MENLGSGPHCLGQIWSKQEGHEEISAGLNHMDESRLHLVTFLFWICGRHPWTQAQGYIDTCSLPPSIGPTQNRNLPSDKLTLVRTSILRLLVVRDLQSGKLLFTEKVQVWVWGAFEENIALGCIQAKSIYINFMISHSIFSGTHDSTILTMMSWVFLLFYH